MKSWAKQKGFTIVELLIVIVVIAILAAITIVAYSGIQLRTHSAVVQADMNSMVKQIEQYKILSSTNTYPSAGSLDALNIKVTKSAYSTGVYNLRYCLNTSTDNYIIYSTTLEDVKYIAGSQIPLQESVYLDGWGICAKVGLASTNPNANGYHLVNGWQSWVE